MSTYDLITTRARNEGIEEGIEKGIEKGKIETILNAFYKGHPLILIADITGMTEQEVKLILKEHGRG